MKKILLFLMFSIFRPQLYANDGLVLITYIDFININYEVYIELKYDISIPIFVSDELVTGFFYSKETDNILRIIYHPRGDMIRIADERTKWPSLVRKIYPGDLLVCRINLRHVIEYISPHINEIDISIQDNCFVLTTDESQAFLTPKDFLTKKELLSQSIKLIKKSNGFWQIEINE